MNEIDEIQARREWALRCCFDERDVAWIDRLYPAAVPAGDVPGQHEEAIKD